MKRSNEEGNLQIRSKKSKLSKEERKILYKEARKIRLFELKKNSPIKDPFESDCEYYFENGLRKVQPYYFTFQANVKERWLNKNLFEIFSVEFYEDKPDILKTRIDKEYLLVNNKKTNIDYILQANDVITHRIHRHEMPVIDQPIKIIHDDKDMMVVCKPSSIPIHPVSKYNFNTVLGILAKFHGINQLRVIHRIDRMTSGILILGKNFETSSKLSQDIRDRQVSKYYLAVVKGPFNDLKDEPVECNLPLGILCPKVGLNYVKSIENGGKESLTKFKFLNYNSDSDSSLVLCKPYTGRSHQIRIHLQYLGYPITNDTLYNCTAWGPDIGKNGVYHKSIEKLIEDLRSNHKIALYRMMETGNMDLLSQTNRNNSENANVSDKNFDPDCDECQSQSVCTVDPTSLVLYLHAYRYRSSISNWDFSTDLPLWTDDFFKNSDERKSFIEKLECLTNENSDF